jgi:single-strand DNA-binding protein
MEETKTASLNVAVLRGACSSPADVRVLPSEEVLAQLQVTTRLDGRAMSVPVAVLDPPAWVQALENGDEVLVVGHVRRRFFRVAGATASRVEIVAEMIAPARDRRRLRTAHRRIEALLEAIVMQGVM